MSYELTDSITVFERRDWGARSPRAMTTQSPPKEAFLHHTTDHNAESINNLEEQKAAMRAVQAFHMDVRGWSDIAYAYIVFQPYDPVEHARIFEGRLTKYVPAAQLGHNTGTLPICVFGNFDHEDSVKKNTRYAIEMLLTKRPEKTGAGSVKTLGGHRDVVGTECPGDTLYAQLDRICDAANVRRYHA